MSARVSVQLSPETGQAVAVKLATGPEETERLAAEARLLRRHPHPGIVPFVDYRTSETGAELHTQFVGPPLDPWHGTTGQVAGLVAALASTVDDLHRTGTAHGRIDRYHVLLGTDGRPVLCGLARAADGTASPADDVHGLGNLLIQLLEESSGPGRPLRRLLEPTGPRRRLGLVAARATAAAPERRPTARALAQQVLDAAPDARLPDGHREGPAVSAEHGTSADVPPDPPGTDPPDDGPAPTDDGTEAEAAFAAAFVDLSDTDENEIFSDRPWVETVDTHAPQQDPVWEEAAVAEFDAAPARRETAGDRGARHHTDRPPSREERPGRGRRGQRRGRVHLATAALVLAGAVGVGGGVLAATMSSDAGTARGTTDDTPAERSPARDDPCPGDHADTRSEPAEVIATYEVDTTGDGCVETVAVTDAGVVESGESRWVVGAPDDEITLGDWNCDGTATPAVLRPSTGAVFVFPDWAEPDTPVSIEPLTRTSDGRDVLTEPADGDAGCDTPVVELADGSHRVVEVSPR